MSNPNVVVVVPVSVNQAEADMMIRLLSGEMNKLINKKAEIEVEARATGVGRAEDLYEIDCYLQSIRCTMNRFKDAF